MAAERVRIWANGTEFEIWEHNNCDRCVKAPTMNWGGCCDLNDAIALACVGDGTVAPEIAARLGYAGSPAFWCREFQGRGAPAPAARAVNEVGTQLLPGFEDGA